MPSATPAISADDVRSGHTPLRSSANVTTRRQRAGDEYPLRGERAVRPCAESANDVASRGYNAGCERSAGVDAKAPGTDRNLQARRDGTIVQEADDR